MAVNINPAASSTIGYCGEIGLLQYLHLPFCSKKLNTGMRSIGIRTAPQEGQDERGLTIDFFSGTRHITTLKKEPSTRPVININKITVICTKSITFGLTPDF